MVLQLVEVVGFRSVGRRLLLFVPRRAIASIDHGQVVSKHIRDNRMFIVHDLMAFDAASHRVGLLIWADEQRRDLL